MARSEVSRTLVEPSCPVTGAAESQRECASPATCARVGRTAPAPDGDFDTRPRDERGPLHVPTPLDMPPRRLHVLRTYLELRAARLLFR